MGYPTSALATSRARTATGLSNVAVSQASSALRSAVGSVIQGAGFTSAPLPANWDIPGISQPTGKPPTPANIPGGSGVGPAPTGSPQPVGSPRPVGAPAPARPLPSPRSGPVPASPSLPRGVGVPSALPGALGALRAMNAASWGLMAAMAAASAYEWWRKQQYGHLWVPQAAEWDWEDPNAPPYLPDPTQSYVTVCGDTPQTHGPYPGAPWCGLAIDVVDSDQTGVEHEYEVISEVPEPFSREVWEWVIVWRENPELTARAWPAVRAHYEKHDKPPAPATPPEHWPEPWQNPAASPFPSNSPMPGANPAPEFPPMIDPLSNPIKSPTPAPTPIPIPYGLIPHVGPNPNRSPTEQPQRGNGPLPGQEPAPPRREPPERPGDRPKWPKRPGAREKEKKLGAKGTVALGLAMGVTEVNDIVTALWEALPPYIRRQYREGGKPAYPPIARMYKDVYKNWDVVDAEAAVENLLINQIEDMVIGSVHSAIDKALGPVATTKWQNNPTKPQFEKDLAKAVNDVVEPIIRDLVDPEVDRGTAGQLGALWDRLE